MPTDYFNEVHYLKVTFISDDAEAAKCVADEGWNLLDEWWEQGCDDVIGIYCESHEDGHALKVVYEPQN